MLFGKVGNNLKKLLDMINNPKDLKKLDISEFPRLSKEIRTFLLNNVSKTGGHLASNLGIVELTIALHYCFDMPKDKIVWDVGHQAYVHKILTGRKNQFNTLRKFNGLSGFPKPDESEYDCFATGHSSTSISAALAMAYARDLSGESSNIVAVIGDGSMTGGLAYEALNNAGRSNRRLIVILNDNEMSISRNVGALSKHLNDLRTEPFYLCVKEGVHNILNKLPIAGKSIEKAIEKVKDSLKYMIVPGVLFEEMGFNYVGHINGHNINELVNVLNKIKKMDGPILLHVITKKGKGYKYSEERPWDYHGVNPFNIKTGEVISKSSKKSYSSVFGKALTEEAEKNKKIVAVSAAMTSGTGLDEFQKKFKTRFFDVGIAEQHAVTFSAGLASCGYIPVFAVYSTFLQRAYDQIIHDVCLQNLHVIFAIDRAGIVGADGETHQGVFDISFLSHIPNMTILAPKSAEELKNMIKFAVNFNGPIAIRYPRGSASEIFSERESQIEFGKSELLFDGSEIAIISAGTMMDTAFSVYESLAKEDGANPILVNARFLKPVDKSMIEYICKKCKYIFTIEDNLKNGGFGLKVLETVQELGYNNKVNLYNFAFDDIFVEHGSREELFEKYGLDSVSIYNKIKFITNEMDELNG